MSPRYSLPENFEDFLESRLRSYGFTLQDPVTLAKCILKLSNIFIRGEANGFYWADKSNVAAYLSYFAVLNFIRARYVMNQARLRGLLDHVTDVEDFGCGTGAATWALFEALGPSEKTKFYGSDQFLEPLNEFRQWCLSYWKKEITVRQARISLASERSPQVAIFSYSLNESDELPIISTGTDTLIVIEPSTHQAGRSLLKWRDELIAEGWYAVAPCVHQQNCPLLRHSGKDWCHHRMDWIKPEWFSEIEAHLPMKNNTLTLSYIIMSRHFPAEYPEGSARVIGDQQEERGKNRQAICRGPQREFLSWLHRDNVAVDLQRGNIITLDSYEQKVNELRIFSRDHIKKIE